MKAFYFFCALLCLGHLLQAQNYTSFFTGNSTNVSVAPFGGVCLMGGATEDDNAMRWFLERANGGDVLVIRASGSDGYNDYFFSQLGITINSVETIVFNNATAAQEAYIHERINEAEAIWIAGGNQWNYVSYWRNTPIAERINSAINDRNIVIGGTSAGMAILGGAYFTAENGTVTSLQATNDPYNSKMAISNDAFLQVPYMSNVITDTHYDDPDRRGRHFAFLARAMTDYGETYYGIACEEYTAVCIDPDGMARVFGGYPDFNDAAFFLIPNCALEDGTPEQCTSGQPLTWDRNDLAVKGYQIYGTPTGLYTFDVANWNMGTNGFWQDWSANEGLFQVTHPGEPLDCMMVNTEEIAGLQGVRIYPNPVTGGQLNVSLNAFETGKLVLYSSSGQRMTQWPLTELNNQLTLPQLPNGMYQLEIRAGSGVQWTKVIVSNN